VTASPHLPQLAEEYLTDVLEVAAQALNLLEAPDPDVCFEELRTLNDKCQRLEVAAAALMLSGGHTWDRLAKAHNVKRQSLHRRLSSRVTRWTNEALVPHRVANRERLWAAVSGRLDARAGEAKTTGIRGAGRRVAQSVSAGTNII
jgi:hypothetical protein